MADNFSRDIEQAYKEVMVKQIGFVIFGIAFIVGATIISYHWLTLMHPDPCADCFDELMECRTIYDPDERFACFKLRQTALDTCSKICEVHP